MTMAELVETLHQRGAAAGTAGIARADAAIVAAAAVDLPHVATAIVPDGVALTAPGLLARARGTRRQGADPRLLGLVASAQTYAGQP